jgi:ubiquinone biosynthesis protein UbiJ
MSGKVIAIHVKTFDETFYLCPSSDRMQLLEHYEGKVDARISGSLSALGLMGLSAMPMRSLFKGEVRIEGDTQLARTFQRLFEKLDINLSSKLAIFTGDAFAQRLTGWVRGGRDWSKQSLENFKLNLEEFLQEETRELPAKVEAELLFQHIDTCRCDSDRLQARIDRLQSRLIQPLTPQNS